MQSHGRTKFALLMALIFAALPLSHAQAPREVHVLAAADLQPVMPALADAFQHATVIKLVFSFGSSSTLATKILTREQNDLFIPADYSFAQKIVSAKPSRPEERTA